MVLLFWVEGLGGSKGCVCVCVGGGGEGLRGCVIQKRLC